MTPPEFVRSQLLKTHWTIEAKITWSSQYKRTDFAEIKAIARRGPGLKAFQGVGRQARRLNGNRILEG